MASMTSSTVGDGSWQLTVAVMDLKVDAALRVKGDLHIGGLMLRLVQQLEDKRDWSDYGLWWPARRLWLLRTRCTLDQYGVQADTHLEFTTMHKHIDVLLPDLQVYEATVNFAADVFSVVIKLAKELGIRHPEELSLARRLTREELKQNRGVSATRRTRPSGLRPRSSRTPSTAGSQYMSVGSLLDNGRGSSLAVHSPSTAGRITPSGGTPSRFTSRESLFRTSSVPPPRNSYASGFLTPFSPSSALPFNANGTMSPNSMNSLFFSSATDNTESPLINSPLLSTKQAFNWLYRPANLQEKARINAGWLDSSRSLMEQGVCDSDLVLLRFKFFAFYDLNPRYDAVRINELYEQAKWSVLSEQVNCSVDEMFLLAALQLQVHLLSPLYSLDGAGTDNNRYSCYSQDGASTANSPGGAMDHCRHGNNHNALSPSISQGGTLHVRSSSISPEGAVDGQCSIDGSANGHFPNKCPEGSMIGQHSINGATNGHSTIHSPGGAVNGHCLGHSPGGAVRSADEQIDAALSELERMLEGTFDETDSGLGTAAVSSSAGPASLAAATADELRHSHDTDVTQVPQLADELRFLRAKKGLWWRSFRKFFFMFKDLTLSMYRTSACTQLLSSVSLRGCDVNGDASVSASRFIIKLFIVPTTTQTTTLNARSRSSLGSSKPLYAPSSAGQTMTEIWLRTDTVEQYSRWLAAFKLASRGRTMADTAAFELELRTITSLLRLQQQSSQVPASPASPAGSQLNINPADFIAPRFLQKLRTKQVVQRLLEANGNVSNLSLLEAKQQYIKAWQSLPDHAITLFIVQFKGSKRQDLLGVAVDRLVRLDMQSGATLRTWRYSAMKSWSVNWDKCLVNVSFEDEDLVFQCLTADCKVVHEFIGGYIFLSMRSGDRSQTLNEELFHKLTGGWIQ